MSLATAESQARRKGPVRVDRSRLRLLAAPQVLEEFQHELPPHHRFSELPDSTGILLSGVSVVRDPSPTHLARPARWRELEWLSTHPDQVEDHRGQWVLVEPEGIVAASATGDDLAQKARDLGLARPFVLQIPARDPGAQIT